MEQREQIIRNYLEAYNRFDIAGMLANLHPGLRFEHIEQGRTTLALQGRDAFEQQATQAATLFTERKQTALRFLHDGDNCEVSISYYAVLAADLPNGMTKGMVLNLQGSSVFTFSGNQITRLTDIS